MSLSRILTAASAVLILASCQGSGRVDASYPTVTELDSLDAQWGLSPRQSRGAPKRSYQYSAPKPTYGAPAAAAPAVQMMQPRETQFSPPPDAPTPQLDPAAVNSLR